MLFRITALHLKEMGREPPLLFHMQADLPPWIIFSDFEKAEWASQMLGECIFALHIVTICILAMQSDDQSLRGAQSPASARAMQHSFGHMWTAQCQTWPSSGWSRSSRSAAPDGCWMWQLSSTFRCHSPPKR